MNFVKLLIFLCAIVGHAYGNTKNDPHAPIGHCYHWISQSSNDYLTFKYNYAKSNGNELTFHTTPGTSNGSVAGPGLYCAKSPSGSYSYGDRVIRIDFVEDVVLYDEVNRIKYCGLNGVTSNNDSECASKQWDLKFYSGGGRGYKAWYVIQNPDAINSWSANSEQLVRDLNASIAINDSSFRRHAENTIQAMQQETYTIGSHTFINEKARRSIIKLALTDPSQLDSLPPLSVVSRLARAKDDDRLPGDIRLDIYRKFLGLALSSNEIPFSDYKDAVAMDQRAERAFIDMTKLAVKNNTPVNATVLLNGAAVYPELANTMTDSKRQDLVNTALSRPASAKELSNSSLSNDKKTKVLVKRRMEEIKDRPENKALASALSGLLNNYYSGSEKTSQKSQWIQSIYKSGGDVELQIGGKSSYWLSANGGDTADQCMTLLSLTDLYGAVEIRKGPNILKAGAFTFDNQENSSRCKIIAGLTNELMDLKEGEKLSFVLNGTIEGFEYIFVGDDVDDMDEQCSATYDAVPNKSVDQIFWSVNGSQSKQLYNSDGYWKTKAAVCAQIKNASAHLLPDRLTEQWKDEAQKTNPAYIVAGRFEKQNFYFYGDYLEEIEEKCDRFYSRVTGKNNIDDIYFSINNRSESSVHNSDGYYNNKTLLCSALANSLANTLPSKLDGLWKSQARSLNSTYIVEGDTEGKWKFFLYGENLDEIKGRCEIYYANRHRPPTSSIRFWVNDSSRQSVDSDSPWRNKSGFCQALAIGLKNDIPSKAVMEMRIGARSTKAKYIVEGDFEGTAFIFYGDAIEDIQKQCNAFYPSILYSNTLDTMSFKVNDKRTKYVRNGDFWRNSTELCDALAAHLLRSGIPQQYQLDIKSENASNRQKAARMASLIQIEGIAGGLEYFFHGKDLKEIKNQCKVFVGKVPRDKRFSQTSGKVFNGRTFDQSVPSNTSFSALCNVLTVKLKTDIDQAINSLEGKKYSSALQAYFELFPETAQSEASLVAVSNGDEYLLLKTFDHREAIAQCEEQVDRNGHDISGVLIARKGSSEIDLRPYITERNCDGLVGAVGHLIKPSKMIEHENNYPLRRAKYSFEIKVNNTDWRLYGNDMQELEDQCLEVYSTPTEGLKANFQISWRYVEKNRTGEFNLNNEDFRSVCIQMAQTAEKATKKGLFGFLSRAFGDS